MTDKPEVTEQLKESEVSALQAVDNIKAAVLSAARNVAKPYNKTERKYVAMKRKATARKAKKKGTRKRRN